jgi:hypothetical protein
MIRRAMASDMDRVIRLCRDHHAEQQAIGNPNFDWPFDPARVSLTFAHAISSNDWLCLVDGGPSLLLAHTYQDPLGGPLVAIERILRGDLNEMVRLYEDWARAKGCVRAVLSTTHRHRAFERLYRRLGYALAETVYSKAL